MPSLVEQIFLQAEAGQSREVGALSRAALTGLQLGSREKLQREQLKAQNDPNSLPNLIRAQQLENSKLDQVIKLSEQDEFIANKKLSAEAGALSSMLIDNSQLANDPEFTNQLRPLVANPLAPENKSLQNLLNRVQRAKSTLDVLSENIRTPGGGSVTLGQRAPTETEKIRQRNTEGQRIARQFGFVESGVSNGLITFSAPDLTPEQLAQQANEFREQGFDFKSVDEQGNFTLEPISKQVTQEQIDIALDRFPGLEVTGVDPITGEATIGRKRTGTEITTPEGFTFRTGVPTGGEPTTATRGASQKRILQNRRTLVELNDLINTIRPQDVGLQGAVGSFVFDNLVPLFNPEFEGVDLTRIENRTKTEAVREGAMRVMSADPRFSNVDRAAISKILPSLDALKSFPRFLKVAQALKNILATRVLIDAFDLKLPIPEGTIDDLDNNGIRNAFNQGLIKQQDAIDALKGRQKI